MEKKQFHRRGLGMLLLLAVILFGLGSSLYDAQMIHGAEYLARSQNSIAETQTVEAARGDKGFARCHTSYLVNLFYVKGVHKLELTLITGETLPISQPKRKTFLAQLTDYWGDML